MRVATGQTRCAISGVPLSRTALSNKDVWRLLLHATLIATAIALLSFAALAHASPDPHMPDPFNGNCPGGGGGNAFEGYCDGLHYPDGSYWHKINYGAATAFPFFVPGQTQPTQLGLSCVIDPDGGPIPQPAPPGGCGGAVK